MLTQQCCHCQSHCHCQRTISVQCALGEGHDSGASSVPLRSSRRDIKTSAQCSLLCSRIASLCQCHTATTDWTTVAATSALFARMQSARLSRCCSLSCCYTGSVGRAHPLSHTAGRWRSHSAMTAPTFMHNDSSSAVLRYTLLAETSNSQQASRSICESTELHCRIDAGALPADEPVSRLLV